MATEGRSGCGCLLAALGSVLFWMAFGLGFAVLFAAGPREWVAETLVGCDGPVEEETTTDFDGESSSTFFCEKDGSTEDITFLLILWGFGPMVVVGVGFAVGAILWKVAGGVLMVRQGLRGRRRPPGPPGGWTGSPGGGWPGS